jgi:hypothetical protein
MSDSKQTGAKAASNASKTLRDHSTGDDSKSGAGSALSQTHAPGRETSDAAASSASETLSDGRTSATSKSASGSALAQKSGGKK